MPDLAEEVTGKRELPGFTRNVIYDDEIICYLRPLKEIIEIQDIYTDMRGLRHDMRSHLANISLLVKNVTGSVYEELESYIGKMKETVGKLDFTYLTNLLTDSYDIAVILNNALENAIEACRKTRGNKQIKLHSYVKGSQFFIEVENDFTEDIVIEEKSGLPVSSKERGKLHGIGISNIQRFAKKYKGDIDIEISDTGGRKKFNLTVMMNGKPAAAI